MFHYLRYFNIKKFFLLNNNFIDLGTTSLQITMLASFGDKIFFLKLIEKE